MTEAAEVSAAAATPGSATDKATAVPTVRPVLSIFEIPPGEGGAGFMDFGDSVDWSWTESSGAGFDSWLDGFFDWLVLVEVCTLA